ncbi:hypothetical protein ACSBR1_029276 [Camellia fascicularis]
MDRSWMQLHNRRLHQYIDGVKEFIMFASDHMKSGARLLYEMLRSMKTGGSKSTWKVLIMDKVTVKIMSYSCKMADITEEGVSCP